MIRTLFTVLLCSLLYGFLPAQVFDSIFGVPYSFDGFNYYYGITTSNFSNRDDRSYAALHLPDGKIILAGHTTGNDGTDLALVRLLPNGHYDESAGPGGRMRINLGHYADSCIAAVLDGEGRIVVAGCARQQNQGQYVGLVARTDIDGQLDTQFGNNGSITIDLPSDYEIITKIISLPDGRLLIAGDAYYGNSIFADSTRVFIGRLLPDGTVDSTFGVNGFVYQQFDPGCRSSMLGDMAVDGEGRIIISGASFFLYPGAFQPNQNCWHVVDVYRYTPEGQPDDTFGYGGRFTLLQAQGRARVLHAGANGKILLAGSVTNFQDTDNPVHTYLGKILPSGGMDSSFAYFGGFTRYIIGGIFPAAPADLLEFEDFYYMGFEDDAHGPGTSVTFGLFRFSKTGEWDQTFGNNGRFRSTEFLLPYLGGKVTQISTVDSNYIFISGYHYTIIERLNMFIAKIKLNNVVSSTAETTMPHRVKIFPNPVSGGRLYLDVSGLVSEGPLHLRLSDMQGRPVWQRSEQAAGGVQHIDVSQLPRGVYALEIIGSGRRVVERVVVQ